LPAYLGPAGTLKAVYLAPAKALVQEKVREWQGRFGTLGLTIKEVTGTLLLPCMSRTHLRQHSFTPHTLPRARALRAAHGSLSANNKK